MRRNNLMKKVFAVSMTAVLSLHMATYAGELLSSEAVPSEEYLDISAVPGDDLLSDGAEISEPASTGLELLTSDVISNGEINVAGTEIENPALVPAEVLDADDLIDYSVFEKGYVKVVKNSVVYKDAEMLEAAGTFKEDAVVYAKVVKNAETAEVQSLQVIFDTAEAIENESPSFTVYLNVKDARSISEEEEAVLLEGLKLDEKTRKSEEILLTVVPAEVYEELIHEAEAGIEENVLESDDLLGSEEIDAAVDYTEDDAGETDIIFEEDDIFAAAANITITKQPSDAYVAENASATFSVAATGDSLSYLWQYSDNGGSTWKNTTATGASYTWKVTAERNNRQVRCKITEASGAYVLSEAATAIISDITITTQPSDAAVEEDASATFTVVATGDSLTYLWQYSDDGGVTWKNTTVKTASYTWKVTAARNNRQVRCKITSAGGTVVISDPAVATIRTGEAIVISEQPQDVEAAEDTTVTFKVTASGNGLTYVWQYSDNGGNTWKNTTGRAASYSWKLTAARNNRQVRCLITDADGNELLSDPATAVIKENSIVITKQPADVEAAENATVGFSVTAEGNGLTYLWQYSDNGGSTWKNTTGKAATYSWKLTAARNNRQVRCLITDADGNELLSDPATAVIKANPIVITKQPVDVEAAENATVGFSVTATGNSLAYLWQYSDNGGSTWKNTTGKAATYSWKLTAARNNRQVRCLITDADGNELLSDAATAVIMADPITITKQPADVEAEENKTVGFSVTATGNGLTYLWQYSDNGGSTWKNTTGTAATYSWKLTVARNNRQVRCVITDANGNELISDAATAVIIVSNIVIDEVTYEKITDSTCRVLSYSGSASSLTIPEIVEGMTVIEIGEEAFMGNTYLNSIDLPDTIVTIKARAFKNCTNLSSMN